MKKLDDKREELQKICEEVVRVFPPSQKSLTSVWEKVEENNDMGNEMKKVLDDIQSGRFAREWIAENDEGLHKYDDLREADLTHPVEKIGKELRAMMPWLESTT